MQLGEAGHLETEKFSDSSKTDIPHVSGAILTSSAEIGHVTLLLPYRLQSLSKAHPIHSPMPCPMSHLV